MFANNGHTFMYVAGLRFDTVARAETGSRWSNRPADESNLSDVRRPPPAGPVAASLVGLTTRGRG